MKPAGTFAAGTLRFSGCPDSIRSMSGSGCPFGPTFHGVWQSLHTATVTKYCPRSTGDITGAAGAGGGAGEGDEQAAANSRPVLTINPRPRRMSVLPQEACGIILRS